MWWVVRFVGVLGLCGTASSCATILGIDDADCGPMFPGCSGANADTDAAANDAGDPADLCDEYCSAITANCTGENVQYPSYDFCVNVCTTLPPGAAGDATGNSIQCRFSRAKQTFEPNASCQVAGPSGGGVCGTLCDSFCTSMLVVCDEFASRTACLDECEGLADLGRYDSTIQEGPERQCRLYHVNAAASDAQTHCPHAAGATPCAEN